MTDKKLWCNRKERKEWARRLRVGRQSVAR